MNRKSEYHELKITACIFLIMFFLPFTVFAGTAEEKGLSIAREMERRGDGYQDFTAEMLMILRSRDGEESIREIRVKTFEVEDDGDKSMMIFDNPRDVKGTAFLTYSHKRGDDDQWLYLPALKRVKRISSSNKSGSFMGSEFAYEDIASQEVEKYTYKWLRDEVYGGRECFVVERYPVDNEHSGYSRLVTWIDRKEYRPMKVEYYDRKNRHLKTLTFKGYEKYLERYWRAGEMHMVNHRNGKSTTLRWSDYEFRTGLTERDFDMNSLKRAR